MERAGARWPASGARAVRREGLGLCWWGVAQLFNHQTHHRGQVTTLLMQAGHDPGVTDLIAMLRSA